MERIGSYFEEKIKELIIKAKSLEVSEKVKDHEYKRAIMETLYELVDKEHVDELEKEVIKEFKRVKNLSIANKESHIIDLVDKDKKGSFVGMISPRGITVNSNYKARFDKNTNGEDMIVFEWDPKIPEDENKQEK